MSGADHINEPERPGVPLCCCDPSMGERIQKTILANQRMRIVGKAVMRLVEKVIEDRGFVTIATGKQMPEIARLQIRERSHKVAAATERTIGVKPLQIEQRVGTSAGSPAHHPVKVLKVVVCAALASPIQRPVLVERQANDIAIPTLDDELDFRPPNSGRRTETILHGFGPLQSGTVDTAQQNGLASGGDHDAVPDGREARQSVR